MRVVKHKIYNLCLSVVQSTPQKLSLGAHSNLAMGIVGARINSWINWMPPTFSSNVTEPFSNRSVYDLGLCSGHPNWCWDSSQLLPFSWAWHVHMTMSEWVEYLDDWVSWYADLTRLWPEKNMLALACDDDPTYVSKSDQSQDRWPNGWYTSPPDISPASAAETEGHIRDLSHPSRVKAMWVVRGLRWLWLRFDKLSNNIISNESAIIKTNHHSTSIHPAQHSDTILISNPVTPNHYNQVAESCIT